MGRLSEYDATDRAHIEGKDMSNNEKFIDRSGLSQAAEQDADEAVDTRGLPGGYDGADMDTERAFNPAGIRKSMDTREKKDAPDNSERSEAEHTELISTANKGFRAARKLVDRYGDQTEVRTPDGDVHELPESTDDDADILDIEWKKKD